VSLEDEFWNALKKIAGDRSLMLSELIDSINAQRQYGNLSSALRLFVLEYYRGKAAEEAGRRNARPTTGATRACTCISGICGTSSCFANTLRRMARGIRASLPAPPFVEQKVQSGVDLPLIEVRPLGVMGVDPVPSVLSHDFDTIDPGPLPQVVTHRLEHEVF
jgi:predicted DNA-binding ribbon-helix-helix protein